MCVCIRVHTHDDTPVLVLPLYLYVLSPCNVESLYSLALSRCRHRWYGVNYDSADPFRFGKDLGCNFAQQSCFSWMQMRRSAG